MKYTVLGFQQNKLIENNLSLEDALLLRTIKDMYSSDSMESLINESKRYIWVNQSYLLQQIPIIGSMSKLKRMLTKLCDDGFLESIVITNKKGIAGRFYYVKHTQKMDSLSDYDQIDEPPKITKVQNDIRPNIKTKLDQVSKWPNKDTSIKDYSIKDTKELKDKCSGYTEDGKNKRWIPATYYAKDSLDLTISCIQEFDRRYMNRFDEHHAPIRDSRIYEQLNSIFISNSYYSVNEDKEFQASFDIMILAMDKYFNTEYKDCDYKIWHFLSDGILTNLLRKVAA